MTEEQLSIDQFTIQCTKRKQVKYHWRMWSADEDNCIRSKYGKEPPGQIAIGLNRTLSSIHHRARKLGLAKKMPKIGDVCRKCGVSLSDDNQFPSLRKRHKKLCKQCGGIISKESMRRRREKDPAGCRKSVRDWNRRQRTNVLEHYSGKPAHCVCCGEATYEFLAIDHINGGGTKHIRESLRKYGRSGSYLWKTLKKEGLPDGYRVLCHNCNMAYGFYGFCPHQNTLKALR